MRPVEIILSLLNAVAVIGLAFSLPRFLRWMRELPVIAVLTAVSQAVLEGARWQMIPAYALSGLLCAIWVLQFIRTSGGWTAPSALNISAAVGAAFLLLTSFTLPLLFPA